MTLAQKQIKGRPVHVSSICCFIVVFLIAVTVLAQHGNGAMSAAGNSENMSFSTARKTNSRAGFSALPALPDLYQAMRELQAQYPERSSLNQIGVSTFQQIPIWAIKISSDPAVDQDKSSYLFTGLHHAREPLGFRMCMRIAESLLSRYHKDKIIRKVVDQFDVWIVPVVNPDGFQFMKEYAHNFPWWRKNQRDNNGDGKFEPHIDGVDLNRNYGYNWRFGGNAVFKSWFYRGPDAFSEAEVRAVKRLAERENVLAGLSFHSYGELVLYPWGNHTRAPDHDLILKEGRQLAGAMKKNGRNESYGLVPLDGRAGQSSVWMYGQLRAIDYTVELADGFFPDSVSAEMVLKQAMNGVEYFLARGLVSTIVGHVKDADSGIPLAAEGLVAGFEADHVGRRRSDKKYGRFERWLEPGFYSITFRADGYKPVTLDNVEVFEDRQTKLDVYLGKQEQTQSVEKN